MKVKVSHLLCNLQAVGISVEFVSHMTRSFALSTKPTHVERAIEATAKMGSAVSKARADVVNHPLKKNLNQKKENKDMFSNEFSLFLHPQGVCWCCYD